MLTAVSGGEAVNATRVAEIQVELEAMLAGTATGDHPPADASAGVDAARIPAGRDWRIGFRPDGNIFRTGNDPLRILRELAAHGELEVQADLARLPPLAELDPEVCYLRWDLRLAGVADRDLIEDAFAWVADESDLSIEPIAVAPNGSAASRTVVSDPAVAGELLVERRKTDRRAAGDRRGAAAAGDSTSIRVSIDKVDAVMNLVGELVITQSVLSTLGGDFDMNKLQKLRDGLLQLERNTRELQESVMRIRMLPISFVFNRFPRLVHDLSGKLGKHVELKMSGEGTEVDKTVIEKMADPLVHLVRNSLDHGIESPAERRAAGKPETGSIWLNAYHKGGNIVIEVKDDGHGLDTDRIHAKAMERGLITADARLSTEQIYELLFMPGFSTAETVSDVSGRGVGMDVVRSNIRSVGGSIEIASEPGRSSTFTIRLPLTMAILDGQSVLVGTETYILPLVSIVESVQARAQALNRVVGKGEMLRWRDEHITVLRLHELFGVLPRDTDLTRGLIVVVEAEGRHLGLFVDDLLGQQQVVIKSLEANYRRIEGVSGATILGDGSVALILDIPGLIRQAQR
jgi:two-component system chemotaxis sensor kinase CheA